VPFSLLYVNEYSKEYSYSIAEAHTCLFVAHTEKRKSCSLSILSNLHKSLLLCDGVASLCAFLHRAMRIRARYRASAILSPPNATTVSVH